MAATATRTYQGTLWGPGGARFETGMITFDSDATVELKTSFKQILHASFTQIGSAAALPLVSVDEANASGIFSVPSTGAITVDAASSTSGKYSYLLIGR